MTSLQPTVKNGVYFSYVKESSDKAHVSQHCHDKLEIICVTDGEGKYIVEGVEYPFSSRTVLIIPPLSYHSIFFNSSKGFERYVVRIDLSALSQNARDIALGLIENETVLFTPDAISPAILSIFERVDLFETNSHEDRCTYESLLISELLFLLSVAKKNVVDTQKAELGARVIRYINDHIDKDVSLDMLAKRFFVSKYYLCRAFKEHNGISVHGYINQKRVMYAKQLIDAGESASVASYRVGFGDYSAFYRAYVKIIGSSPTSKRKEG